MTNKILEKIIIKPQELPERRFDLSFKNSEDNAVIISALQGLKVNEGWQFLSELMNKNLEWLAERILNKTGDQGEELSDAEIDKCRLRYKYVKELLDKPDFFIEKLSKEDEVIPDLDPYQS